MDLNLTVKWEEFKEILSKAKYLDVNTYNEHIKNSEMKNPGSEMYFLLINSEYGAKIVNNIILDIKKDFKKIFGRDSNLHIVSKSNYLIERERLENLDKNNLKNVSDDKFSLDNFIIGTSNEKAVLAIKRVIEEPGGFYNPLFIFGNPGLGKTHLLKASEKSFSDKKIIYYSSDNFRKEIVDALIKNPESGSTKSDRINNVKSKFLSYDILLIDDIQMIAKNEKTIEVFFDIFNECIANNKQLIITSDKQPGELHGFDSRLISRFTNGINIKIELPDEQLIKDIILAKTKLFKLDLDEKSINYISAFHSNDIRNIEGVIHGINFHLALYNTGKKPTYEDIKAIMVNSEKLRQDKISCSKIKDYVANLYGISTSEIDSENRTKKLVNARHLAMYLTKELTKLSNQEIAIKFGKRDHTTVIYACKKINESKKNNKELQRVIKKAFVELTDKN